jgi:hypothetical protein
MLRHACRATALLVLVLTIVLAAPSYAINKEVNQSYPLQPGGSFELQNVNGTIDIQGWDRNEVEIHAVKTAKQKESDLERVAIDVEAKPDAVSITTRYPQNEGVEVAVEYTVSPGSKPSRICTPSMATLKCWKPAEVCTRTPPTAMCTSSSLTCLLRAPRVPKPPTVLSYSRCRQALRPTLKLAA